MISKIFTLWVFKKKTQTQYPQQSLVNLSVTCCIPGRNRFRTYTNRTSYSKKTDILLTNDSLVPKQKPELPPSSLASRSPPERETEATGKIIVKLTLCKHKEINYRTNIRNNRCVSCLRNAIRSKTALSRDT